MFNRDLADEQGLRGVPLQVDVVETTKIEYKYCMEPTIKKKKDDYSTKVIAEGLNLDSYNCEICEMGNQYLASYSNEIGKKSQVSDTLKTIYTILDEDYKRTNDKRLFENVAELYNREIFKPNEDLKNRKRKDLRKWTPTMVEYHVLECDRSDISRQLQRDMETIGKINDYIYFNNLYKEKWVNNEKVGIEIERASYEKLLKGMATKALIASKIDIIESKKKRSNVSMFNKQIGNGNTNGGGGNGSSVKKMN